MSESIYQNIVRPFAKNAPESVHLCDYPTVDASAIDEAMEASMASVLDIVVLGRACRNVSALKNRQPVATLIVKGVKLDPGYARIVAEELNIKNIVFTDDASAFTTYNIKPQLRTMGPKYGKLLGKINEYLKTVDGNAVVAAFANGGTYRFELEGTAVEMVESDALMELTHKAGFVAQADRDLTVVIDTNLTGELIEEGFVRELISKLQTMRKEAGFEVVDHIALSYEGNARIAGIMAKFGPQIAAEVLADETSESAKGYVKEWNINGETVSLGVAKK
jgi:isoleucyl-tRNA synthetase